VCETKRKRQESILEQGTRYNREARASIQDLNKKVRNIEEKFIKEEIIFEKRSRNVRNENLNQSNEKHSRYYYQQTISREERISEISTISRRNCI
jgi:hypothetical protein